MRRGFALPLGVVLVAAGVSAIVVAGPGDGQQKASAPTIVRRCGSSVHARASAPRRRHDVVAGPVTFYGLRDASRAALRRPSKAFRKVNGRYRPVRALAEVPPNAVVDVSVAGSDRGRARLLYGSRHAAAKGRLGLRPDQGEVSIRLEGCVPSQGRYSPLGGEPRGTFFDGGFLFTAPQCVRLEIYDRLSTRRIRHIEPYGRSAASCRPGRPHQRRSAKRLPVRKRP